MSSTTFRINAPDVIHETFDTEVVIVNLRAGIYYSLGAQGLPAWNALLAGQDLEQITNAYHAAAGGDAEAARRDAHGLLARLLEERVILPAQGEAPALEVDATIPLERHTDVQELLKLDPVHEVAEAGWPHAKPGQ